MPARARDGGRRLVSLARRAKRRGPSLLSQWIPAAPHRRSPFRRLPLDIASWNLFDLGVVTLDGRQHVFTANHNSRQSLIAVDERGHFEDRMGELRLNQDTGFPGWEDDVHPPETSRPGLYLYRQANTVVVRCVALPGGGALGGSLEFLSPVTVQHRADIDQLEVTDEERAGAPARVVVRFSTSTDGGLHLAPALVGIVLRVTVDECVPLANVFVGSTMTSPTTRRFDLHARDRHGMAWADWGGHGRTGAFVARGGLRGLLEAHPGIVRDELLVDGGDGFRDVIDASGIDKQGCRTRQAAWVALGDNRLLDLFVSCQAGHPRLYRQEFPGRFADATDALGLHLVSGESFVWIDVDGDGAPELLAAHGNRLVVYRRDGEGPFTRCQEVPLRNGETPVAKLAVGDHDDDGRPDVFAPSPDGNTLLVNGPGGFRAVDPSSVGLPASGGVTANWVDYDNDGLLDLHVVPGGLFRQTASGRFVRTGLLQREVPAPVVDARASWFDSSGDGRRDALIAVVPDSKREGKGFQWQTGFFRNATPAGHWLQVVLEGPEGNRPAIGARVRAGVGARTITQWVGCNEGSHFSQGEYRAYFGLGAHGVATSVEVRWPDGSVQHLRRPAGDEVVRMSYSPDQTGRPR